MSIKESEMKEIFIKVRFRVKILIRKLKKLAEFWDLYGDWRKTFDDNIAKALKERVE